MIEVHRVDQRPKAQPFGVLRDGGEKHAGGRRHAERRRVALRKVIRVRAASFVELDQAQPFVELAADIGAGPVHVIEHAEFHGARHNALFLLVMTPLAMPCHSIVPASRLCSILGQRFITTLRPASSARFAAASLTTPSCIQTTFAPCLIASSVIGPAASELRKMSTMSAFCGSSSSEP